jgi:ribulose-5-phosphate 4-epimerase/fuculose-1-phosphate aldolase
MHLSQRAPKAKQLAATRSITLTDISTNHSVYGKAFSVFGRELDMITQDSLRFYKDHAVYQNFGGVVLDREEGRKIAGCLGNGKAVILQNHGLITVCFSGRYSNACLLYQADVK